MTSNSKFEKAYIYFDTNSLECYFDKDCLFLSELKFNKIFYEVKQFIVNNKLENKTKICIPEIVFLEIKKHLIDCYQKQRTEWEDAITKCKKAFGDLVDLTLIEWNQAETKEKYEFYINELIQEFIDTNKSILEIPMCPKDKNTIESLIDKAIYSKIPFTEAHKNNKKYSDAGFKDALIYETFHQSTKNNLGILISNDNDLKNLFNENRDNLKLYSNFENLKLLLTKNFNLNSQNIIIENILKTNQYLIAQLLVESGFEENNNYSFHELIDAKIIENGTNIKFSAYIDGEKYIFDIIYEINANELIEVSNITQEVKNK